jgi:hypothetical protein
VLQREFIARLAQTASPQLAVDAMGKNLHGIKKLLKDPGSDSFRAAWERAVELGEGVEARRRIAEQAEIHERSAHLTGPRGRGWEPEPDPEADGMDEDGKRELIENVLRKHALKVGLERAARLKGEVVAADFYLRQISWFEVAMDLISGHGAAFRYLHEFRCGEHYLIEIAETPMSRLLDSHRREQWAAQGEPARPEHPPRRYLVDRGDYSLEPLEFTQGGEISREEQRRRFEEAHTAEAKAQVLWEASAHEAWEASEHGARAHEAWEASEHGAASPKPAPQEDFADRAMREALDAAKRAHPEDFEEEDE